MTIIIIVNYSLLYCILTQENSSSSSLSENQSNASDAIIDEEMLTESESLEENIQETWSVDSESTDNESDMESSSDNSEFSEACDSTEKSNEHDDYNYNDTDDFYNEVPLSDSDGEDVDMDDNVQVTMISK